MDGDWEWEWEWEWEREVLPGSSRSTPAVRKGTPTPTPRRVSAKARTSRCSASNRRSVCSRSAWQRDSNSRESRFAMVAAVKAAPCRSAFAATPAWISRALRRAASTRRSASRSSVVTRVENAAVSRATSVVTW